MDTTPKETMYFTMALRETFMNYFKGTCVDQVTRSWECDININSYEMPLTNRRATRIQREAFSRRKSAYLVYKYSVLGAVSLNPSEMTFFPGMMTRSPEMKEVYEDIKKFFKTYLPGVELKEDTNNSLNQQSEIFDDSAIRAYGKKRDDGDTVQRLRGYPAGTQFTASYGDMVVPTTRGGTQRMSVILEDYTYVDRPLF